MTTGPRPADDPADDLIDDRRRPGRDDRARDRRPDRRRPDSDTFSWRWGELSGGRGTLIVLATAVLGAIVTVVTKRDPGSVLGWLIVAGTAIAGFAVRPRSAYLLVPVPALAYVVFGLAAGYIRHQSDPSGGLAVNAAQWIANGFLTMAAATVLAVVIALGRRLLDRRSAASSSGAGRPRSGSGAGARAGAGGRRRSGERRDQADGARSVSSDSSGLIGQSDEVGFGGQGGRAGRGDRAAQSDRSGQSDRAGWGGRNGRGDSSDWPGRSDRGDRGGRGGRDRGEAPGRPKPAFYPNPNPDWSGDRGQARDPRDRRPPPGPPSFGASRDLASRYDSASRG
ncbi:MAG TPA: DUF6542 domain-containing protein [Streptosporangiaceae bacterium]|jgi:hypothetical protein